jgi:nucleotide-binding universal stress UspA family protein
MTEFRRLVLALEHDAADQATIRQAAALAAMLGAELHALFIEDETLLHASALPFTREISPLSLQWRPLDRDRLEMELRAAADQARRRLEQVAAAAGVRQKFEVHRGDPTVRITEFRAESDIVVVAAPHPRNMQGVHRPRESAHHSAASVLFLPPMPGRADGPIVAVVRGADDPGLTVARRIAAEGNHGLLVLATDGGDGITARHIGGTHPRDIDAALGDTRERLIVMTRNGASAGPDLAAVRGTPVLVVEPL